MNPFSLLIIDDEESILKLLSKELNAAHRTIHTAATAREARTKLQSNSYDVVLSDIRLPDGDGMDLMVEINSLQNNCETILITGHGNIDDAVEAMRIGAYDYITKPFHLDRVELVIERAFQRASLSKELRTIKETGTTSAPPVQLVGNSHVIKEIHYLMGKVAPTDVPVLITGESGVGKDVVAKNIHALSKRSSKPLVIKNCATLQKELMRSELFGHRSGAFTGATDDRDGLLLCSDRATLFLDEIGELPLEVQGSLLRVLETGTFRRVGEKEERKVDIRFIFATNRNLAKWVEEGTFNEALYHRINVFNIQIPDLKERLEDVPLLVDNFLAHLAPAMGSPKTTITDKAMQYLCNYSWPGNVRELRNVLERSIILADNGLISEHTLPKELTGQEECFDSSSGGVLSLETMEREHIVRALDFYNGNRQQTAKALGIGRKTLYRKLEKYRLS